MKIYTKGGDKGTTSLIGGKRVGKSDPQVEVYGQIDELNAWIGLLAAESGFPDVCRFLTDIQRDLFKIGGFSLAARTHVARTVCRRVERCMDGFACIPEAAHFQGSLAKAYINRLSDYLFVLARFFQHQSGHVDVLL